MKIPSLIFRMILLSAIIVSCTSRNQSKAPDVLVSHIDSTVVPGDNFFLYANGKWFQQNPIPASEASNGIFLLIQDTINAQVLNICRSAAALPNAEKGSNMQKIGDFYYSGMDSMAINKNGLADLQEELSKIDRIYDVNGIVREAAVIHSISASPLFRFYVSQDDKLSNKNAIFIMQGGLSLPDRRNYFDKDAKAIETREKFTEHLARVFEFLGFDEEKAKTTAVNQMKLETSLAQISRKSEDTRDPLKNYNKVTFRRLNELTPNISWNEFTENAGLHNIDSVIICQPEFITGLNGYLKSIPINDWKNYLKYQLLKDLWKSLDDRTYLEFFNFYEKTLNGVNEPKPRWKRVVEHTNNLLGELIGQVYVHDYLPKNTKEKLLEIGNATKDAYAARIKNLDWMSEPTKAKALGKLKSVLMKVGYPDKWKDMSSIKIDPSSYVHNTMKAREWWFNYMVSKYGKPVDRSEWNMEPQTYNAYYNPSNNEICVPGCNIIIPGYERQLADDALLYSIIGGSTFGHEITHGFDDQGCKYDSLGNLNNWWTASDSIKFYEKTRLIIKQFDAYVPVDSLHINGSLTQGENIADLGGIMIGYDAFSKTKQFRDNEKIGGLTPSQRFFLGYALAWMVNQRPELLSTRVRSDEHSPAEYRVIGPLSDIPEFYTTFGVKEGNSMWRPDSIRVKIW
jgi:putative endopeptidase